MNRNWITLPGTDATTRDYTDPDGPVPAVTATINRADGRYWWNIAVTDRHTRDRRGTPRRTVIATGTAPATPHALAALKGRITRLAKTAAHLERQTATEAALAELHEAIEAAGHIPAETAPTAHLRRCAWERDIAAARLARLQTAA